MNIEHIRNQFPALARTHNGIPVAYFDAPGGTQVPVPVADAMRDYLFHHNANTHWAYPTSAETDAILLEARKAMADLLNAGPDEIVFGNNMTTLTCHVGRALGRQWERGDEVIVTELDHHANVDPWKALTIDRGIVIRKARMIPETGQLDYDHLVSLLGSRTKLIAIGGASNAIGTINDLARVVQIAKSANALTFVDAVHLTPHELIDVKAIGCDFLACSSYKFYGPHAGILYGRNELLNALPFVRLKPAPQEAPERAETGTQNHEAIAGILATVEFLASIGGEGGTRRERLTRAYSFLHQEGTKLTRMMWDSLSSLKRVCVYGTPPSNPRTPTISFTVEGMHADDVARKLAEHALFVSSGNFYAQTVCERHGIDALVRVGCGCYTTEDEVARLIRAVGQL
jgi:cysteine desulfurase family protein (TIGR01976 family)